MNPENLLYRKLNALAPDVMAGVEPLSGMTQRNGEVSLTFRQEAFDRYSIIQYATFYGEEDVTVCYQLIVDDAEHSAKPVAIVLNAPPQSMVYEAQDKTAAYLLSLLETAATCDLL